MPVVPGARLQPEVHQRDVSRDLADIAGIRQWVAALAATTPLDATRTFDLQVVACEAVANAIEHGEGEVRVAVSIHRDRLVLDVTSGGLFQVRAGRDQDGRRRGLGLPLMASMADQLVITRTDEGKTHLSLTFIFAGAEP